MFYRALTESEIDEIAALRQSLEPTPDQFDLFSGILQRAGVEVVPVLKNNHKQEDKRNNYGVERK